MCNQHTAAHNMWFNSHILLDAFRCDSQRTASAIHPSKCALGNIRRDKFMMISSIEGPFAGAAVYVAVDLQCVCTGANTRQLFLCSTRLIEWILFYYIQRQVVGRDARLIHSFHHLCVADYRLSPLAVDDGPWYELISSFTWRAEINSGTHGSSVCSANVEGLSDPRPLHSLLFGTKASPYASDSN